jgi:hypothetical protein
VPRKPIKLTIVSEFKPVFDWAATSCGKLDLPDAGLRAFRRNDNSIEALAAHYTNYFMTGDDLFSLKKNCHVAYNSRHDADPAAFNDQTWIAATWTDDGRNVVGVGHLEYHGELHKGHCNAPPNIQCRYGALLHLVSYDGGADFTKSTPTPLAAVPDRQSASQPPSEGFFQPSNVFERDGWKYVFIRSSGGGSQPNGTCLMRSSNPMNPKSWEIYDGAGFHPSLFNPYEEDGADRKPCAQISTLTGMVWSVLTYRDTGALVAIVSLLDPKTGKTRLATATSDDVLHWGEPLDVENLALEWGVPCPKSRVLAYPSLIDPASKRRNFDDTGSQPVMFMTGLEIRNCKFGLDRDLRVARVRLEPGTEADPSRTRSSHRRVRAP